MVDKCNPMQWIVAANVFINVFMERNLNFAYIHMSVCSSRRRLYAWGAAKKRNLLAQLSEAL